MTRWPASALLDLRPELACRKDGVVRIAPPLEGNGVVGPLCEVDGADKRLAS